LARILRDPDLVVATWDDRRATYVNADGEPVQASMPGRAVTRVDRDGHPSLLIVHDDALEGDSRLREAVETVESMDAVNAQWRAEVARHAADVVASRRRLLGASDDERRRLAQELSLGVQARLADLTKSLRDLERAPGSHLERAIAHLDSTRAELAELAAGLRPRALESGLEPALRELVARLRLTGDVAYEAGPLPTDVEVTAYYVCAESLANVAKHVPQARVTIDVNGRVDRSVVVQVADDGPGGADPTGGGLLGLRDRVESLGGRLELTSSTKGTTVRAELPLDAH
jgi:signal transduction histidine kinase